MDDSLRVGLRQSNGETAAMGAWPAIASVTNAEVRFRDPLKRIKT